MSRKVENRSGFRGNILAIALLISAALISAASLLFPLSNPVGTVPLDLGDVSSQDILAPVSLSYQSEILTEQRREDAAAAVSPQYNQPDTSIARNQVGQLRDALNYIHVVRDDAYASQEQKIADLAALQSINLSAVSTTMLLDINDSAWQTVRQESITVL